MGRSHHWAIFVSTDDFLNVLFNDLLDAFLLLASTIGTGNDIMAHLLIFCHSGECVDDTVPENTDKQRRK